MTRYDPARLVGVDESSVRIYLFDEGQIVWQGLPTTVDTGADTATTQIDHLTVFGVFGGPRSLDGTSALPERPTLPPNRPTVSSERPTVSPERPAGLPAQPTVVPSPLAPSPSVASVEPASLSVAPVAVVTPVAVTAPQTAPATSQATSAVQAAPSTAPAQAQAVSILPRSGGVPDGALLLLATSLLGIGLGLRRVRTHESGPGWRSAPRSPSPGEQAGSLSLWERVGVRAYPSPHQNVGHGLVPCPQRLQPRLFRRRRRAGCRTGSARTAMVATLRLVARSRPTRRVAAPTPVWGRPPPSLPCRARSQYQTGPALALRPGTSPCPTTTTGYDGSWQSAWSAGLEPA